MSSTDDSRIERVQQSFQKLADRASTLNQFSDQVGKAVDQFNAAFRRLNLGVAAWIRFSDLRSPNSDEYSWADVGYDKIQGQWGLAIRSAEGDEQAEEPSSYNEWLFNDAPRALRLASIDKLPELFEKIVDEVEDTAATLEKKLKDVQELAKAISPVSGKPSAQRSGNR